MKKNRIKVYPYLISPEKYPVFEERYAKAVTRRVLDDEIQFTTMRVLALDENNKIIGSTSKLLIGSTTLGIEKVVELVHGLGGLAIASHVDRESFSLIGQLGFVPEDLALDGLELSWRCGASEIGNYESYGLPLVQSSDSHFLADVGKVATTFTLSSPSYSEVAMAFEGVEARGISI